MNFIQQLKVQHLDDISREKYSVAVEKEIVLYLNKLEKHYRNFVKKNEKLLEAKEKELQPDSAGRAEYLKLKFGYTNESMENFVRNKNDFAGQIITENGYLIQNTDLIYLDPYDKGFFDAHFYAPRKRLFGMYIDTFWANTLMIWMMTLFLGITLYFDGLKKLLNIGSLFSRSK